MELTPKDIAREISAGISSLNGGLDSQQIGDLAGGLADFGSDVSKGNANQQTYALKALGAKYNSDQLMVDAQNKALQNRELWTRESAEYQNKETEGAQEEGSTTASQAAQGVSVRSGASENVNNLEQQVTGKDLLTLQNNAYAESFGLNMEALNDTYQSKIEGITSQEYTTEGNAAGASGFFSGLAGFGNDVAEGFGVKIK
ncbi:MAG: hypothetical protein ACRDFB_03320 [Rhabdochlamydiaceae bacterium]